MRKKPKKLVLDLRPKTIDQGLPLITPSLFKGLNEFQFSTKDIQFISDERKIELRLQDLLLCSYSKKQSTFFGSEDMLTYKREKEQMDMKKAIFIMEIELNKILKGEICND